ncbi:trypsin-like serine protease [Linderina pennispora]|uniref:Trypsin-like serine protease n=1 Tax=Linderina pennispora TaxID=61395 RepID=A0A1Y1VX85_9FUNG|nr:trypsin-like serine protease [Linderina pennispora]ORX65813.1 trypsin-like serine protease [Linderina pennispora]
MNLLSSFLCLTLTAALSASAAPINDLNKRIIGGYLLGSHGAPYAVKIAIDMGNNEILSCGGSILTKNHILTAAHCVVDDAGTGVLKPSQFTIGYGDSLIKNQKTVQGTKVFMHPGFKQQKVNANDLAIIQVPDISLDGKSARAISIFTGSIDEGQMLVAMGWGTTKTDNDPDSLSDELKAALVHVGDKKSCQKFDPQYQSSNGNKVCALNKFSPGNSTCKGDSGSAVVIKGPGGYYLAGLVSQGGRRVNSNCGTPDGYSLFTRISSHLDFIASVTGADNSTLTKSY